MTVNELREALEKMPGHWPVSYSVMPERQPGENRAAHRARLKAERRARKVPA